MIKEYFKAAFFALRGLLLHLLPKPERGALPDGAGIRILIIRLDRIGDLALTTPLFRILRTAFPGAIISALVRANNAEVIRNDPNLNNVFSYENILKALISHRNNYDLVIDPVNSYVLESALLARLLKARVTIGFDVNNRGKLFTDPVPSSGEKKHFVEFIPDLVSPLNIAVSDDLSPRIFTGEGSRKTAASFLSENGAGPDKFLITVHPGSFHASQRWPKEYFLKLINRIGTFLPNAFFILLGSEEERTLLDRIYADLNGPTKQNTALRAGDGIGTVIGFIEASKLFIGNNSGLLHIATGLKVPTVSFMGPTVPWLWRPRGPGATNLLFRKELACSPCNKGLCDGHECMKAITPEEVFATLKPLLERRF